MVRRGGNKDGVTAVAGATRLARLAPNGDRLGAEGRIAGMRKFALVLVVVGASLLAAASAAGVDPGSRRTAVGGGVSIRVPARWHLIGGWLSDVSYPVPRLAVASFPATLSRHTCECGSPNVVDFPRAGAFLFVWEYPHYPHWALSRIPRHAARYRVAQGNPNWFTCAGPSWETGFRESDSVFQVEVYLGPAAGPKVRAQMDEILNSLESA